MAREVRIAGNLPTGEVDGLQAGANLLHSHVAGKCTEGVDVVLVVHEIPQDLGSATSEGLLLDDGALELDDLIGRVVTSNALPARLVSQSCWSSAAVFGGVPVVDIKTPSL